MKDHKKIFASYISWISFLFSFFFEMHSWLFGDSSALLYSWYNKLWGSMSKFSLCSSDKKLNSSAHTFFFTSTKKLSCHWTFFFHQNSGLDGPLWTRLSTSSPLMGRAAWVSQCLLKSIRNYLIIWSLVLVCGASCQPVYFLCISHFTVSCLLDGWLHSQVCTVNTAGGLKHHPALHHH